METMPEYPIDKHYRIQKVKDIFNVFMETMPEYPIDKQDTEGKARSANRLKPVIFQIIVT